MAKRSHDPNFVGVANERLASTLAKNLTNMELFSKRDAVSSWEGGHENLQTA